MKAPDLVFVAALSAVCLGACAQINPFAPLPASKRTTTMPARKLEGQLQTFTGKVVLVVEGYRFRPADESENLRLTRAGKSTELVAEEINLRKYYGKTLTVRGKRDNEWIWAAEVMGQWLRPGEMRGSTLTGPEPAPQSRH